MGIESAALIFQAVGAGVSAAGAMRSSQATEASYNAQAQVQGNNALLAEYQARDAERRGRIEATQVGYRTNQAVGTQRAALAASGVDLGFGSAMDIVSDTEYFGSVDRATTIDNAAREAWGYRSQGANYTANAQMLRKGADAQSPMLAGATSLIGSAGRVAAGWYGGGSSSSPLVGGDGLSQGDRRKIGVF